jgi:urease accessory protein
VVQRPFHPEGPVCHVYLVHPPGGVVGGDQIVLQASIQPRAHALLTTPGATRFYRCGTHPRARLLQQLDVKDGALEWLPQETIVFSGARACIRTEVRLQADARFIGWEICCLGRPASGEDFEHGELQQDVLLWRDGVPLLFDRLRLTGGSEALESAWGLAGARVCGTFLGYPGSDSMLADLRALQTPGVQSALTLVDGLLHGRAISGSGEALRRHFTALWTCLRPALLRRFAIPPRIWAT